MGDRLDGLGTMGRRDYLRATGVVALGTAGIAGCVGRATGTLATSVTDQPADIGDFESLLVTIDGVWIGPEGGDGDDEGGDGDDEGGDGDVEDGDAENGTEIDDGGSDAENGTETDEEGDGEDEEDGREYHEFDEPQEADLVQLQGDETQLIDERELETGTYPYLQLDVSGTDATLADGGEATVELPGNAPLTFNQEFEIREDSVTSFTADFAPVKRGDGTYLLRPVPRGIEVSYDEESE
ncbi:DUF4382 domain-containing protein [Halorubrum sp. 48-1-W]|uniref:DUF4382 domain-containing protein n=1 Tax=Halorubrum sp. 48-1-W TaxID=2249761 RepID=UPI000DCD0C36|nr:DUF4382 domain-containing protein [Halorubrum sp. 48-1-W]RAW46848.1 DUF4382 domain-containing protein [Halorubrum sp. 48-1-W]